MLSYQHIYHAGNAADLHKHALLAWVLEYLTAKDKPLSYLETHAGRALYDLGAPEAQKTAEAQSGILRAEAAGWLPPEHPLMQAVDHIRAVHGPNAYPGSPMIAHHFLRENDRAALAELHPGEWTALHALPWPHTTQILREDGFAMAHRLTPPTPRRGLMLVDPSYEIKADYQTIPPFLRKIARKWNVGILMLWYPMLSDHRQRAMADMLAESFPDALRSELHFAPARPGHGMIGSGIFVINPPWGMADEAARIESLFANP